MGNSTLLKRLSEAQYVSLILFSTLILNLIFLFGLTLLFPGLEKVFFG